MKKSILIHAWTLYKNNDQYLIPYTHWVYLNEIIKYYDNVCLLSPVIYDDENKSKSLKVISTFKNISVYELPFSKGYISSIFHFFYYKKAYKELSEDFEAIYCRYPIPFGWLQKKYFNGKKRIIHFVGDPIDTIVNNPNFSIIKKKLMVSLFKVEHFQYLKACKDAKVYTNGYHLSEKLSKQNIHSIPLISSTLNDNDFYFDKKIINPAKPRLIYVGYLRKTKGVETIIKTFILLKKEYPEAELTIVGTGELECFLQDIIKKSGIDNITFTGHIDDRNNLNKLLRRNDIFCFGSLSEGSPRVVLEAMANGLVVVSTPVGSLPNTFIDGQEILFADFNNEQKFCEKIISLINDNKLYNTLRVNSFDKVSNYKITRFIKIIFDE